METFGQRLTIWRTRSGLTQRELGEALEVSQTTITLWETGKALPRARRAPELARILQVSVDEVARSIVDTASAIDRDEPMGDVPVGEKPDIPGGAALLSGRLKDLSADDIWHINDLIERLAERGR